MPEYTIDTEYDRRTVLKFIEQIPLGKKSISITNKKSKRRLSQNNLFWLWATVIADDTGYTKQEIHDIIVELFCPVETKEIFGKVVTRKRGTSDLSVSEMSVVLNDMDMWAANEIGILLPHPEDQYYEAMGLSRERHTDSN